MNADDLRLLAILAGIGIAILTYLYTTRRDMKWKRTAFLLEEGRYFDTDAEICAAVQIMAGDNPSVSVQDVLGNPEEHIPPNATKRINHLGGFDKMLNYLDRMSHACFDLKTLRIEEVNYYSWHLRKFQEIPALTQYCQRSGSPDVLRLAASLRKKYKWTH